MCQAGKTRTCSVCGLTRPLEEFPKHNRQRRNGEKYVYFYPYCKECVKKRDWRTYVEKSPQVAEHARSYNHEYYKKLTPLQKFLRSRRICAKNKVRRIQEMFSDHMLFNQNGTTYCVVEGEIGKPGLLVRLDTKPCPYIVASILEEQSWHSGEYYGSFREAWKDYAKRVGADEE